MILSMVVGAPGLGFSQDIIASYVLGPGFCVLPITRTLTETPMPISFNGISSPGLYSGNPDDPGENK